MGSLAAQADDAAVNAAAELQDAAINYESAAEGHVNLAESLLRSRKDAPSEEASEQQRDRRNTNARLELQAAEQFMNAASNFDHAHRSWNSAAQATQDEESRNYFRQSARDIRQRATSLMRRAAALAEHAALEYASTNDLRNQSRASHRAGRIREQLADRR